MQCLIQNGCDFFSPVRFRRKRVIFWKSSILRFVTKRGAQLNLKALKLLRVIKKDWSVFFNWWIFNSNWKEKKTEVADWQLKAAATSWIAQSGNKGTVIKEKSLWLQVPSTKMGVTLDTVLITIREKANKQPLTADGPQNYWWRAMSINGIRIRTLRNRGSGIN